MKKSERLNQELIFIHRKKQFNLRDLMTEFRISKRTALRDIIELEELDAPLYAESGKNGGYHVLPHQLRTPIYFKETELLSIFFALQLLKNPTPFPHSYQQIKEKLAEKFSVTSLEELETVLSYEGVRMPIAVPQLEILYQAILAQHQLRLDYQKAQRENKIIQPVRLNYRHGFWYCFALDVQKQQWRTYRCDKVSNIHFFSEGQKYTTQEIQQQLVQQQCPYCFEIQLTVKGCEMAQQQLFPNMTIVDSQLKGTYHEKELDFLVNYLLMFGTEALILKPRKLKQAYLQKLQDMQARY